MYILYRSDKEDKVPSNYSQLHVNTRSDEDDNQTGNTPTTTPRGRGRPRIINKQPTAIVTYPPNVMIDNQPNPLIKSLKDIINEISLLVHVPSANMQIYYKLENSSDGNQLQEININDENHIFPWFKNSPTTLYVVFNRPNAVNSEEVQKITLKVTLHFNQKMVPVPEFITNYYKTNTGINNNDNMTDINTGSTI